MRAGLTPWPCPTAWVTPEGLLPLHLHKEDIALHRQGLVLSGFTVDAQLPGIAPRRDLGVSVQGPNSKALRTRHKYREPS